MSIISMLEKSFMVDKTGAIALIVICAVALACVLAVIILCISIVYSVRRRNASMGKEMYKNLYQKPAPALDAPIAVAQLPAPAQKQAVALPEPKQSAKPSQAQKSAEQAKLDRLKEQMKTPVAAIPAPRK